MFCFYCCHGMNIAILSTKMWYCFVNLVWLAKTYLSWIRSNLGLYLNSEISCTFCRYHLLCLACLAVYRKRYVLIYSNLNCDLKMNLDHMSMMILKHLLQVGLGLVVKSLSPCCFLKKVYPALPEVI